MFLIFPHTKRGKKALERKPEIFNHPKVGLTMADGGELIKKKEKDWNKWFCSRGYFIIYFDSLGILFI